MSDGDWYTAGLYGRYDRGGIVVEASAAYNHARYTTQRVIDIPGAVFTTPYPGIFITLPSDSRSARSANRMNGFSARLAAGYDFEPRNGWTFGPRVEGSAVYGRVSGYKETGAGILSLTVGRTRQTYGEAGAGLAASRMFTRVNGSAVVASLKVMGMYGGATGNKLNGALAADGGSFSFKPDRRSGLWCLPEASLTWKINDRVNLTAAYAGRFGKRYIENTGSLNISVRF